MLKKTITYNDIEGNSVTDDFYFNLTKAEISELELSVDGGLRKKLVNLSTARNSKEVIATFKEILKLSLGRRSDDGRYLIKNDEVWQAFANGEAYSTMFMDLIQGGGAAIAEFVKGILPADLAASLPADLGDMTVEQIAAISTEPASGEPDKLPAVPANVRQPSDYQRPAELAPIVQTPPPTVPQPPVEDRSDNLSPHSD